jgi:hypothetical protein
MIDGKLISYISFEVDALGKQKTARSERIV